LQQPQLSVVEIRLEQHTRHTTLRAHLQTIPIDSKKEKRREHKLNKLTQRRGDHIS
jgi:hypothetical protein